ncbi:MAG TPA: hypothetical protein VFE47_32035 [Tepidisphaeraceae bacterium]|jgi:hypothetical protein|nr:hypothetical protein [Tepidisphaeraceae bacterium]
MPVTICGVHLMALNVRQFAYEGFSLPTEVTDLTSFRRWVLNPEFPKTPRYAFLDREIWVDGRHDSFAVNQARLAVSIALARHANETDGTFFTTGMRLTHIQASASFEPEGIFWTRDWEKRGLVDYGFGPDDNTTTDINESCEIVGSPEILLSVMPIPGSLSNRRLFDAAMLSVGPREWWQVDVKDLRAPLKILNCGREGFYARRESDGFCFSEVMKRFVRLKVKDGRLGLPKFSVEER